MTTKKAAAYLRMSSDSQELSPQQQRREVLEYARRQGYEIVKWYVDEGISASKGDERRLEYQQLLLDSNLGEWSVVVVWSTSRFTRNHPHESAIGKKILKNNGVTLDSVKEGEIDWSSFEGVLKDTLFNLIDHKYSLDLSKDSLRGRRNTFLSGGYPHGNIPFGYDHLYRHGTETKRVRRGTKTKNMKGWIQTLAVVEEEAEVVRRIFSMFLDEDKSMLAIANALNREGVKGPGRAADSVWTVQIVRCRLNCEAYAGISRVGNPKNKNRPSHTKLTPEETRGDWVPIIDRPTFAKAQKKLEGFRVVPQEGRSGALQGIVRCGICGHVLHKENPRHGHDPRGDKYRCASPARGLGPKCHRWTVYEADILPRIVCEVIRLVDEETLAVIEARPDDPYKITNAEVLGKHLQTLERRLEKATDELLDSDRPALKKALEGRIVKLAEELDEVRKRLQTLQAMKAKGGVEQFREWWQGAKGQLLLIAGADAVRAEGVEVIEDEDGNPAAVIQGGEEMAVVGPDLREGNRVIDAGKLRGLLKKLEAEVKVYWKPYDGTRKGRGRVPQWTVDHARLSIVLNCGSADSGSASASRRDSACRGGSRRRASRGRGGSP